MRFPNKAGNNSDTDGILRAELKAAGITTLQEAAEQGIEYIYDYLLKNSGEVKTSVIGWFYEWEFRRADTYWICKGPGIEISAAELLHASHGETVRVGGSCTHKTPRERYKGMACNVYHVDDSDGLKALADTIRKLTGNILAGAPPCKQSPVAWEYENEGGVKFLTFNNPDVWHNHDIHGFKNFMALVYAEDDALQRFNPIRF